MDNTKDPGIAIQEIRLLRTHVEMVDPTGEPKYHLSLVGFARAESPDGKDLDLQAGFDVMHGVQKPPFRFTCEFVARYQRQSEQSMPWKDFSNAMALTHIIPYVREFVSNMTNRLPVRVLILPPINVFAMLADFDRRKAAAEQAKTAAPANPA